MNILLKNICSLIILPQTGTFFDSTVLIVIAAAICILGIFLIFKKKK